MENSENLALPYIMPSQAQKHVTHNEAIRALDAIVQLSVVAADLLSPPTTPMVGARYIVASPAVDEWLGKEGQIAAWQDGAWMYYQPLAGWTAYCEQDEKILIYNNDVWAYLGTQSELQNLDLVGINTSADAVNRLTIASKGSLFNHDGDDHRISVNKNTIADTASMVFQNNFSGRAEIGLAGDDSLSFKVSNDGSQWFEALTADPQSGNVIFPNRPVARATLSTGWYDAPANSKTGFNVINVNRGGFSLGNDLATGPGKYLVVPATGVYLVVVTIFADVGSNFRLNLIDSNSATPQLLIETNESPNKAFTQEAISLISLDAGSQLSFEYAGFARCFHAHAHTELALTMI